MKEDKKKLEEIIKECNKINDKKKFESKKCQMTNNPHNSNIELQNNKNNDNYYNETIRSQSHMISDNFLNKNNSNKKDIMLSYTINEEKLIKRSKDLLNKYCIYHLLLIILYISYIILFFISKSQLGYSEVSYFTKIAKEWKQGPIISVNSNCNTDILKNKTEDLLQDNWPGLVSGCKCDSYLKQGSCSSFSRSRYSRCVTINSKDPIKFRNWKGVPLCIERLKIDYLNLDITNNLSNCTNNKRSCGIIDSQNNFLCIDKQMSCPINSINTFSNYSLISNLTNNDSIIKFDSKYSIESNETFMIFSNNKVENSIPIDFKTSTGTPCKNPYYENMGYSIYILSYFYNRQICNEFSDSNENIKFEDNYSKIDEMSKYTFYKENGIFSVLSNMPMFNDNELLRNIQLYSKNYFGLNHQCLYEIKNKNSSNKIYEDLNELIEIERLINEYFISTIFMIIFVTLGFLIFLAGLIIPDIKDLTLKLKIKKENVKYIYYFFSLMILIFAIKNFLFNMKMINFLDSQDELKKIFGNINCVDQFTKILFDKSMGTLSNSRIFFSLMNFIIIFINISHAIFILLIEKYFD